MAGDSGTPLARKLGIKEHSRIFCLVRAEVGLEKREPTIQSDGLFEGNFSFGSKHRFVNIELCDSSIHVIPH